MERRVMVVMCLLLAGSARVAGAQSTMVPWLTRSADNSRSGWNSRETILTQGSVRARGLVRTTIVPVFGDARGMEAQPLILPAVATPLGQRDVMVLPSMANVVRGVDAHDGSAIWQTALGVPVKGSGKIDAHQINDHWGCISTGVVDADLKRLYQVCWVSPDGSGAPESARYFMFVLNVGDGTQVVEPVPIEGKSGAQDFNSDMRKQRCSLVETDINGVKTVFGCAGTFYETAPGSNGFCFAFDVGSNKLTAMLALTQGEGAGVWMAGQGPAADAKGNLYLVTGNGNFDGVSQWGESFLKLEYVAPSGGKPATLKVVDHWTPWTDRARAGRMSLPATKLSGTHAPSEAMRRPVGGGMSMALAHAKLVGTVNSYGVPTLLVYPKMASGAWADEDWGSAGPACIFPIGVCVAAGKDGIAYPVRTDRLGGTTLADLKNPKANCAKLAGPPVWLTMSPGQVDPCPMDPTSLNFFPNGVTAHLHMTPVQYLDPVLHSWTIFAWGENAQLHKWAVSTGGRLTYLAQGHEYASADVRGQPPGGMPGGFCSGSSNGTDADSAVLVCSIPYGNANQQVVNGRLLVYDPVHLDSDGSLKVLWDSQDWGIQFKFNKFDPPVIDGGEIFVANYNGGVDVYQLAP
ncbi:MAG TPA: hypothetical protein VFG53_05665 [Anaeromyxobacter sp.]|nr:hypothetical protein [Anaeromyxobacter sp.]